MTTTAAGMDVETRRSVIEMLAIGEVGIIKEAAEGAEVPWLETALQAIAMELLSTSITLETQTIPDVENVAGAILRLVGAVGVERAGEAGVEPLAVEP